MRMLLLSGTEDTNGHMAIAYEGSDNLFRRIVMWNSTCICEKEKESVVSEFKIQENTLVRTLVAFSRAISYKEVMCKLKL